MEFEKLGTMGINKNGHLEIGQVDTLELVKTYGTPLYVYDVAFIRERAQCFKEAFANLGVKAQVAYASKAFSAIAIYELMAELDLSLDVVSAGELYTAIQARFPSERIHFHGNNKTKEEIEMALDYQIGCFVIDNYTEIELLKSLLRKRNKKTSVLIRVTPGVEAHTHDYILTGQDDSKFGFGLTNGQAEKAIQMVQKANDCFDLIGLHCHIGSQIFETSGFKVAARRMIECLTKWQKKFNFNCKVLNLGGGFGVKYTEEDEPLPPSEYVKQIVSEVKALTKEKGFLMPEIWIEPGRSLVSEAGITLYKIGSYKDVPGVRRYLAIDGGMTDNIRPALYDAHYHAVLANAPAKKPSSMVSIAGKCCESGDMLIWDLPLPEAKTDDVLAVFCTGAYGYAMASNYNRIPRPAVVFVEGGNARLVIRRESYANLVQNDLSLH